MSIWASMQKLTTVAAIASGLVIIGGVWSSSVQQNSSEKVAREEILRIDNRLYPHLLEYQGRIERMHSLYDDNRKIKEGFDFTVIGAILCSGTFL